MYLRKLSYCAKSGFFGLQIKLFLVLILIGMNGCSDPIHPISSTQDPSKVLLKRGDSEVVQEELYQKRQNPKDPPSYHENLKREKSNKKIEILKW